MGQDLAHKGTEARVTNTTQGEIEMMERQLEDLNCSHKGWINLVAQATLPKQHWMTENDLQKGLDVLGLVYEEAQRLLMNMEQNLSQQGTPEMAMMQGLLRPWKMTHHHAVPSTLNRLAVMDLHSFQSSALHTHSPYFNPVQFLMLSIHIVLGLPHPLFPSIFPSSNNLCIPFCLIKCPKSWIFFLYCCYQ